MVFERFSPAARQVVVLAADYAAHLNASELRTEHLLFAALDQGGEIAAALAAAGATSTGVWRQFGREAVDIDAHHRSARRRPAGGVGQIAFSLGARRAVDEAAGESDRLGDEHVEPKHILLGLLDVTDGRAAQLLTEAGVDLDRLRTTLAQ
jgi:ATP-dependent Clp protease ATP-binding subunit ClpA